MKVRSRWFILGMVLCIILCTVETGRYAKHGQDIRYSSAEITGSYPVRTNSQSHNCCAETGKRV